MTDQQIIEAFRAAGLDLSTTPNGLYTVRGQHAQLLNGARALLAERGSAAPDSLQDLKQKHMAASLRAGDLRESFERECSDADLILRAIGLDPEIYRTEGGSLNVPKIKAAIAHPDDYPRLAQPGAVVEPPEPLTDEQIISAIDELGIRVEPSLGFALVRLGAFLAAAPVVPSSEPPDLGQILEDDETEREAGAVQRAADGDRADGTWLGFEFEVWQDDMMQAGASAENFEEALKEARHYALMYGQDGPVKVCQVIRRWIDLDSAPAASGNNPERAVE